MAELSMELGDHQAAEMTSNRIGKVQPNHPALAQLQQAIQGAPATI